MKERERMTQTNLTEFPSQVKYDLAEAIKAQPKGDTRNFKGYWFEIMVCKPQVEAIPHVTYACNPSKYIEWKSENQKNEYDGVITLPNGQQITLEFKYRDCPKVYHSWFMDCWNNRTADVFVTNNPQCVSYNDRRLLESKGQKTNVSIRVTGVCRQINPQYLTP